MAGLFGCIDYSADAMYGENALNTMLQYHKSRPSFQSFLLKHHPVYCGYAQPDIIYDSAQFFASKDNVSVWFDGELYNHDEISPGVMPENGRDASVILHLYNSDTALSFLKATDGIFTGIICDWGRQKLIIINDRYGLQHIHWSQSGKLFVWATEYKSFTSFHDFTNTIDSVALDDFIRYGYIAEDRTWFKNVKLLPPATILTLDLHSAAVTIQQYWSWGKIRINEQKADEIQCAREWGRLFENSMNRRLFPRKRIGITLSGGLDSRAILAALPSLEDSVHTFTFGEEGCDDIRIATKVAALKGTVHHNCLLDQASWLDINCEAVWAADGEIALLDTNGNEYLKFIAGYSDICLNGFGGDAVHGGSFLDMKSQHVSTSLDPYGYRGRRYIRQGFRFDQSFYLVRCPFYDNKLVEFQMSLPLHLRKKSFLYNKTLLNNYPTFFKAIPWQKTGVPISYPTAYGKLLSIGKKGFSHILRATEQLGFHVKDRRNYVSHRNRTLLEPGRSFIDKLLNNPDALYVHYINRNEVVTVWNNHLRGKSATDLVNRYATFEIWLQQIFEKKYRPKIE
jgi:asparagine synthase (glutamine-hydrolysing)